jgi:hypothetical protein
LVTVVACVVLVLVSLLETTSSVSLKDGHLHTRRSILGYELTTTDTHDVPWLLPEEFSQRRVETFAPFSRGFRILRGSTRICNLLKQWAEIDTLTPIKTRADYFRGVAIMLDSVSGRGHMGIGSWEDKVELIDSEGTQVLVTDVCLPGS